MKLLFNLVILFLLLTTPGWSVVKNFSPTDTILNSTNPNTNYSSTGQFNNPQTNDAYIMKYDLSSIGGQTATYAHLYFWYSRGYNHTNSLYRMVRDFTPTQATWNVYATASNWGTAGALNSSTDYTPTDGLTFSLPEGAYQEIDVTTLVNDCLSNGNNCNLLMRVGGSGGSTFDLIDTADNGTNPTYLTIATGTPGVPNLWYVRDGGGPLGNTTTTCNGTANVKFTGSNGPNCAVNNPMIIAGVGNAVQWTGGDIMYVDGDSDISYAFTLSGVGTIPAVGDEYTNNGITYTVTQSLATGQSSGILLATGSGAPTASGNLVVVGGHGSGTSPIAFSAEGPGQAWYNITSTVSIPEGASTSQPTSIIGTGSQKPQFWTNSYEILVLNAVNSYTDIENLDMTTHNNCITYGPEGPSGQTTGPPYNADNFPYTCTYQGSGPFGITGIQIGGTGLTITNTNVHGFENGMNNAISGGIVGNVTLTNVKIFGNSLEGLSIGQGQATDNVMTGTMSFIDDQVDFNGCGSRYPLQDTTDINNLISSTGFSHSEDDESNYYNCYGQGQNGYGDGVAFGPNGSANAGNWYVNGTSISFNTQDGLDSLHGNGNGTISVIRSRMEGNAGQQIKLNGKIEDVEGSLINGDCPRWLGAPETSTTVGSLNPTGDVGFVMGSVCRAGGDTAVFVIGTGTKVYFYGNTINTNGIGIEPNGTNCDASTAVHVYNNIINGGGSAIFDGTLYPGGTPTGNEQLATYIYNASGGGNGTGTCGPVGNGSGGLIAVDENYNLVYNTKNNNAGCIGNHDICGTNPGYSSTIPMGTPSGNASTYYHGVNMMSLETLSNISGARSQGNVTGLIYTNGTNDFNNFTPIALPVVDMGGIQYGSNPTYCTGNSAACTANSGCCSGICASGFCAQYNCGDGVVTAPEVCDVTGPALNGQNCLTQGFSGGTLGCTAGCLSFNTSSCTGSCTNTGGSCTTGGTCCSGFCSANQCVQYICGDGTITSPEVCDGVNLNGQTCVTQGFSGGTLACAGGCLAFDTTGCYNLSSINVSMGIKGSIGGS